MAATAMTARVLLEVLFLRQRKRVNDSQNVKDSATAQIGDCANCAVADYLRRWSDVNR